MEKGTEKGREVVKEEGIEVGIKRGREEGVAEVLNKTAINMINQKLEDTLIASVTGMSIDEIKKLRCKQ